MTQRRLFVGAIALTLAIGGFLLVATSNYASNADAPNSNFNYDNCATPDFRKKKKQCDNIHRVIAITFNDANKNGSKDADEAVVPAVSVTATKIKAKTIQNVSDSEGLARFNDLEEGVYTLMAENGVAPKSAKVEKGKIVFVYLAINDSEPVTESDGGGGTTPKPSASPVVSSVDYHFVAIPVEADKAYGKNNPDLNPVENGVLQLANLPVLTADNNQFKSVLPTISGEKLTRWDMFGLVRGKVNLASRLQPTEAIKGQDGGKITDNLVVSNCIAAKAEQPMSWLNFGFVMKARNRDQLRLAYRVSDTCPSDDLAGGTWTDLNISKQHAKTPKKFTTSINKKGKFFQYKINIKSNDAFIHTISLTGKTLSSQPSPFPSSSFTPSFHPTLNPALSPGASPNASSGPAGEGKINIVTKKLVSKTSPSPSVQASAAGPILPTLSPSSEPAPTSPSPNASPSDTVNPLCYGEQDTQEAANVHLLSIKQLGTTGGRDKINIEDQQTDEYGEWSGLNGNEDNFPADTYQINFGDFNATEFKLVAFCDPDNTHLIRSQSDPTNKKATLVVRNGQTSRLVALYAPRNNPYISMNKYAVPANFASGVAQKILRIVYPGQQFNYLIRYTNSGGELAKNVIIRDVIPAELEVDASQAESADSNLQLQPDSRGGTLVTATIGDLPAGKTGSLQIKVKLKSDVFSDSASGVGGILAP